MAGEIYTFEIQYNVARDFFTVDLLLRDEPIVYGHKMMLNRPLFDVVPDTRLPNVVITPVSLDNTIKRITYDNFGVNILLKVEDI